jgi:hypothetical protein
MDQQIIDAARKCFPADAHAVVLGAVTHSGATHPEPLARIPLSVLNRHGLIAGATGTGKTKTLQLIAEQLSAAGVPVFIADIKGDLQGLAAPGESHPKIAERATQTGHAWTPSRSRWLPGDLHGHGDSRGSREDREGCASYSK